MLKPPSDKISAETREKLLALAEFMEADQSHGFWMGDVLMFGRLERTDRPQCGTAGCIAGHVGFMLGQNRSFSTYMTSEDAAEYLGITGQQAFGLFFPEGDDWIYSNDRAKAVRVLRHFAYTGEVDWSV